MMVLRSGQCIESVPRMTPADVDLEDILHSLAFTNRYLGAGGVYTTAQHSVYVVDAYRTKFPAAPALEELHALTHDFGESFIGDIVHPVKVELRGIDRLEWHVLRVIYAALRIPTPTLDVIRRISAVDTLVRNTEASVIFPARAAQTWRERFGAPDPSLPALVPIPAEESLVLLRDTYHRLWSTALGGQP